MQEASADSMTTNMPELLSRFMETCNIQIDPKSNRVHRLILLRFVYSFGKSISFRECITHLEEGGTNLGAFDNIEAQVSFCTMAPSPGACADYSHTAVSCYGVPHSMASLDAKRARGGVGRLGRCVLRVARTHHGPVHV